MAGLSTEATIEWVEVYWPRFDGMIAFSVGHVTDHRFAQQCWLPPWALQPIITMQMSERCLDPGNGSLQTHHVNCTF